MDLMYMPNEVSTIQSLSPFFSTLWTYGYSFLVLALCLRAIDRSRRRVEHQSIKMRVNLNANRSKGNKKQKPPDQVDFRLNTNGSKWT
jgi:hypothetical protein